jgi:hypothetical protein
LIAQTRSIRQQGDDRAAIVTAAKNRRTVSPGVSLPVRDVPNPDRSDLTGAAFV